MYIALIKEMAERLGVVLPEEALPCTEEEVLMLEHRLGLKLPKAYKEFLGWVGRKGGRLLNGYHWNHIGNDLFDLQEEAHELLREMNFPKPLPSNAFVFLSNSQGYLYYFFKANAEDNPKVYYFGEIEEPLTNFECRFHSFLHFLEFQVKLSYLQGFKHNSFEDKILEIRNLEKEYLACPESEN